MTRTRTTTATMASALAALVLAGCSFGGSEDSQDTSSSQASGTASSQGDTDAGGDATGDADATGDTEADENAAQAGIDTNNPPDPMASVEMPAVTKGGDSTTMTVDLLGVRREGELLVVTFGFTPADDAGEEKHLYGWLGSTPWTPQVVDTTNLKAHGVVRANHQSVATGSVGTDFGPGSTFYAFAVFAAPPKGATITIKAADGAPPFSNVKAP